MIVQSLCRYYDILANDEDVVISKSGYSQAKVSFALVVSREGDLSNIIDLRIDGKKPQPKMMDVPFQKSRAVTITPYFLCDNAKYVFGAEKVKIDAKKKVLADKSNEVSVLEESGGSMIVVSKRSLECFEQFRSLHHTLLDNVDDASIKSFLKFLDAWKPELFLKHPKINEYKEEILAGGNFVFKCEGNFLHKNNAVQRAWEMHDDCDLSETEDMVAQCLVGGQSEPIARLHQKIKGVSGAQVSGASLVSFNDDAFCSYGKEQSFNAPISKSLMFKYTTILNHLLNRESKNKLQIDDTTIVFWAETCDQSYVDLTNFFINYRDKQRDAKEESSDINIRDKKTLQLVGDILNKVKNGQSIQEKDLGIDPEKTKFYILGLSPNNARLAVRFWYQDIFGNFITHMAQHHLDMEIVRDESGPRYISVYRLLKETVPQSSNDKASSPLLDGLLMRAILGNTPYPVQLYTAMLSRMKVERSINYVRAGFIKAYLMRLARFRLTDLKEELLTMSLNEESSNVPYRLGRLFAVLEKAQNDTNKEMKSTINSKYFSSASTTPAVVFPVLLKLAQHHIAKSDWGFKSTQSIEEILVGIDKFPAYLSLEDQGMFMLGYYHQRKDFFKKKEHNSSPAKEEGA